LVPAVVAGGLPVAVEDSVDLVAAAGVLAAAARAEAGDLMRTKEFLSKLEHEEIVQAIRDAELKSSGQIRVFIQRGKLDVDPLVAAQKRFQRLGLHKNSRHNDVLIFVAPRAHKFAIVGDEAIHQKCGDELWQRLVEKMREHFRNEKFNHALIDAIREIGEVLASHFPKESASLHEPEQ
jgi:uncharacterized membrane protein